MHYKLRTHGSTVMRRKSIIGIIRRYVRLPTHLYNEEIIQELEKFGLITKITKNKGIKGKFAYRISQIKYLEPIDPFF